MHKMFKTVVATLVLLLMTVSTHAQFRKGLTQQTIQVVLNRRQPPKVLIVGTNIKVEVISQAKGRDNIAERFKTTLETQILANDTRLRTGEPQPDTVIACTISRLETKQAAGSRQVQVSKKTGEKQVTNSKTGKTETEPVYTLVSETQTFTTVRGDLAVAVQVRERKSNATLDSQTFSPNYNNEFLAGNTPPDDAQVEQLLIASAVQQIAKRLTPTREAVTVMLGRPTDQIDELNKLAQAGLWGRMVEQLEVMKPLPDPKKEAYRLFNIAVGDEALAYSSDDLGTSAKLLQQASNLYGKALEMKPDEKYFLTPQSRIEASLTAYSELTHQQETLAAARAAPAAQPQAPVAVASASPDGARDLAPGKSPLGAMTNKDVIDLVTAGLDDENMLAAIKDAKEVTFDLSVTGLKQLAAAKVSNRVIAAMRAKAAPKAPIKRGGASQ